MMDTGSVDFPSAKMLGLIVGFIMLVSTKSMWRNSARYITYLGFQHSNGRVKLRLSLIQLPVLTMSSLGDPYLGNSLPGDSSAVQRFNQSQLGERSIQSNTVRVL